MSTIRHGFQFFRNAVRDRRTAAFFVVCVVMAADAAIRECLNHNYVTALLASLGFLIVMPLISWKWITERRTMAPLEHCSIEELQCLKQEADYLASAVDPNTGQLKPDDIERLKRFDETLQKINERAKH